MYGLGHEFKLSTAVDMSEEGLSFLSSTPIPEGTRLNMRLIMDREDQEDAVEVRAIVIRNENKRTAVAFESLSRSERQRILGYLSQTSLV
jgi:hypothetical protein